ncbi:MAG: TIGR03618 family F420-dependent PPOX class oxidoreductase [Acidimicrobiia bacterium]
MGAIERTERLLIAPLEPSWAPALFAALDHPDVGRFIGGPDVTTLEALATRIERVVAGPPLERSTERWLNFVVSRRSDGQVLGRLEATVHGDWAEFALVFGPSHWGRGHATEAGRWLVDHLMRTTGAREVLASVDPHNNRSIRLLERLGFSRRTGSGRLPSSFTHGDLVFAMTLRPLGARNASMGAAVMAARTIPADYVDLLSSTALVHVATIGPDGAPQNNPVWFGWDGTHVMFSQTAGRQKHRNLKANPKVALSIVDPTNPYRYLEIRGIVAAIVDDENNAFIDSMAQKYLGEAEYPWRQPGDHRVVVKVLPVKTTQMGG